MPRYDFKCINCEEQVFTVITTMSEYAGKYPCPKCGCISDHRVYEPIMHTWHFKNATETRGVHKAEEALKQQMLEANEIADNQYMRRAEAGTREWVNSGKKDALIQELAEQGYDKKGAVLTSGPGGVSGRESTRTDNAPKEE